MTNRKEQYKVGCAHCGKLVGQFTRPPTQEKINNLPEHKCHKKNRYVEKE